MAVSEAQDGPQWLKSSAAPIAAGALGVVVVVIGATALLQPPTETPPQPLPATYGAAPAATPAPAAPQPGSALPGIQFDQQTPGGLKMGMEIVVKFKDDSKVKDIIDAFWRDQTSARSKFEAWKSSRPEFAKLKLDRVTYSNELVLVHDGSVPADARLPQMREIAKKLSSVADVSYAEPNMTAQPGGQ